MGRRQAIFSLFLMLPILLGYNNCAQTSGEEGSLASSSFLQDLDSSDSQFPGRVRYDYFSVEPRCDEEVAEPAERLYLDFTSQNLVQVSSGCVNQGTEMIPPGVHESNGYNPFIIFFNEKLFVNPKLHQGVTGRLSYKEFCYNEVLQLDLAIQHIQEPLADNEIKESWVAVTVFGPASQTPGLVFNGGYYEQTQDGSRLFFAKNETFDLKIEGGVSESERRGLLSRGDGSKIPMKCWVDLSNE